MTLKILFVLFFTVTIQAMEKGTSSRAQKRIVDQEQVYSEASQAFQAGDYTTACHKLFELPKKSRFRSDLPLAMYMSGRIRGALRKASKLFHKGQPHQGYVIALAFKAMGQPKNALDWALYTKNSAQEHLAQLERIHDTVNGDAQKQCANDIAQLRTFTQKLSEMQRKLTLTLISQGTFRIRDLTPRTEIPFLYYIPKSDEATHTINKENEKPRSPNIKIVVTPANTTEFAHATEKQYSLFGSTGQQTILEEFSRLAVSSQR